MPGKQETEQAQRYSTKRITLPTMTYIMAETRLTLIREEDKMGVLKYL